MSYPSKTEFDNLRNSLPVTYQTRGNYAFRTDLASNINTALKNVNAALANYAKKTDIPVVPTNVATKSDLSNYALASDLTKYQPAGRYASLSELENYQTKGEYVSSKDLVGYAKSADLANFQPRGEYALSKDLNSYAKTSDLANYVPNSALANLAKSSDLAPYAKTTDLAAAYQAKGDYVPNSALAAYAKTADLAAAYQPRGDYAPNSALAAYAKTSDLAAYAKTADLAATYQARGEYALKTDLAPYAFKSSANEFVGTQTFKAGINLAANSRSDLLGFVNITNATIGTLNVTSIKAASIDGYAKTTDLTPYAKTTDLTTLQGSVGSLKTAITGLQQQNIFSMRAIFNSGVNVTSDDINPSTFTGPVEISGGLTSGSIKATDITSGSINVSTIAATRITGGSIAVSSITTGNLKVGGAMTFDSLATFNQGAVLKAPSNSNPIQVDGAGGLRVSGGPLIASGGITSGSINVTTGGITSGSILATGITTTSLTANGELTANGALTVKKLKIGNHIIDGTDDNKLVITAQDADGRNAKSYSFHKGSDQSWSGEFYSPNKIKAGENTEITDKKLKLGQHLIDGTEYNHLRVKADNQQYTFNSQQTGSKFETPNLQVGGNTELTEKKLKLGQHLIDGTDYNRLRVYADNQEYTFNSQQSGTNSTFQTPNLKVDGSDVVRMNKAYRIKNKRDGRFMMNHDDTIKWSGGDGDWESFKFFDSGKQW